MMILIPLVAIQLLAMPGSWDLVREISPTSGDSLHAWALDTGAGPLWRAASGGELHWVCPDPGIGDSLSLSWPLPPGHGLTLHVRASLDGVPGQARLRVAWGADASGAVGSEDPHRAPASREAATGWIVSPGSVEERLPVPPGRIHQLRVLTATGPRSRSPASVRLHSIAVTAPARDGVLGGAPLLPAPRPCPRIGGARTAQEAWQLPIVPDARWRLDLGPIRVPPGMVVAVSVPFGVPRPSRPEPRLIWREASVDGSWLPAEVLWSGGQADTLVGLLDPRLGESGDRAILVGIDIGEGGVIVGPVRVHARPRQPRRMDLTIAQVACAPAEAEFIEIDSRLPWSLPLSSLAVEVDGKVYRCGDGLIPGRGFLVIRRGDCPGLALPNDHADIRLRWNELEIDRLAYGPQSSAPAPPRGWSLLSDPTLSLSRSPLPGGRSPGWPSAEVSDSVALSELVLWPPESPERFVEIAHAGGRRADLAGWALLCEDALVFPEGTILGPEGVCLIRAADFPPSFALNPDAGELTLVDPHGRIVDRVGWAVSPPAGCALGRVASDARAMGEWAICLPTPGHANGIGVIRAACDIEASATAEGRFVQWQCPDSRYSSFVVYRAPALHPGSRDRVSTTSITGTPPFSYIDIDADPDVDYLYWVGGIDSMGDEVLLGPAPSPAHGATLRLCIEPAVPNPFRALTTVSYSIEGLTPEMRVLLDQVEAGHRMRIGVYTVGGGLLRVLAADRPQEGLFQVSWDGRDEAGQLCSPGVYVVSLQVGPYVRSSRIVFAGQ